MCLSEPAEKILKNLRLKWGLSAKSLESGQASALRIMCVRRVKPNLRTDFQKGARNGVLSTGLSGLRVNLKMKDWKMQGSIKRVPTNWSWDEKVQIIKSTTDYFSEPPGQPLSDLGNYGHKTSLWQMGRRILFCTITCKFHSSPTTEVPEGFYLCFLKD